MLLFFIIKGDEYINIVFGLDSGNEQQQVFSNGKKSQTWLVSVVSMGQR